MTPLWLALLIRVAVLLGVGLGLFLGTTAVHSPLVFELGVVP